LINHCRFGHDEIRPRSSRRGQYRHRIEDGPDYEALLRPVFEGRRIILAGGPVAAWTATAATMRRLDAEAVLVVGTMGTGLGPLPPPGDATWVTADVSAPSVSDAIHATNRLIADPPPVIRSAIEEFDPDATALAVGGFLNEAPELVGRPFLSYRRPEWLALEDKTEADAVWDRAQVPRAPSVVVPLERRALTNAASAHDAGHGTVWAADASSGWHGGAEGLRWVRVAADVDDALAAYAGRAHHVRVMPFVEGVPCSIHGIVFDDHVAVVRPVEQVTLRRAADSTFFYAGCATFYDPPPAVRTAMRDSAGRVGAMLREEVAFRGAFTIDGVVGADGFVPTELNPRSGAGLALIQKGIADLPLQLLLEALIGGHRLPYDPRTLEATLLAAADRDRGGGTWHLVRSLGAPVDALAVVGGAPGWRRAEAGEEPSGEVSRSEPSGRGSFVRLTAHATRTATGSPFGPAAAAFWAFADRELGTAVGPLVAASAVD
jgi:hypothetical protein